MFIINWGELDGRVDPLYNSKYLSGFISKLQFRKVKIKNIALYLNSGFAAGKENQSISENSIIQIRPTNIGTNGNFKFEKNVFVDGASLNNLLSYGEVLFNNTNSQELVGKTAYWNIQGVFCCSNHITRIKTTDEVNPVYLKEILSFYQRNKIFFYLCTNWNNQSGINSSVLENLSIPVPPKPIQQQIIDIMDAAYSEKQQKAKEAQDLLDSINGHLLGELGIAMPLEEENTLKSRKFYANSADVLGGRFDPFYNKPIFEKNLENIQNCKNGIATLKSIAKNGLTKGILPNDAQKDGDCKVIQITNINNDGSIDTTSNLLAKPIYSSKHELKIGDILIVITGATIGKIGFWDYSGKYYLGGDIVKFNTGNFLLNEIYSALLRTTPYQLQLKKCITGATNGHLSPTDIERLPLPIMNNDEVVESISAHLSSIRSKAKQLEQEAEDAVKSAKGKVEKILLEGSL